MILTVTLNLALDVTYEVPALVPHSTHRVSAVLKRAGGKGINVSRVLRALGEETLATGLRGGPTGDLVLADLTAGGVPHDFAPVRGETRRVVAVVAGDATVFAEPGPVVNAEEWAVFQRHFTQNARAASVVVLSGSLPQGVPEDAYAVLTRLAHEAGAKVLLDTSGPALTAGVLAGPDLVKPNLGELREAGLDPAALPGALVVSRGAEGLLAAVGGRYFEALPPEVLHGNPTGAGDAAAAALAVALRDGAPWESALAEAVALSGAAVVTPVAGEVDLGLHRRLRPLVNVKEVPCPW
ncbi:hexose kinase [Actinocorallia longicatena]|uniref:1-phosphofructokinase family hexose kinase n=1 Tax=Actinocorallia longicatena TaxID=111803 RepID=A0ABP6QIQ9_9ACTN